MKPLRINLKPKIFEDNNQYFFTLLTDRFSPLNQLWAEALSRRFGGVYEPINILAAEHSEQFREDNYIVLNESLGKLQQEQSRTNIVDLIYPEDLNKQFSESSYVSELVAKLLTKQDKVYVLSFTSVWLNIDNPNVVILGPDQNVAARFDDKAEHVRAFEALNLPRNDMKVYSNLAELQSAKLSYPYFLSATYSSGGIESKVIASAEDLTGFYSNLRPINQHQPLVYSKYLPNIVEAPNTNAIISGLNQTTVTCVSDQILRDNRYMGNIYPSQVNRSYHEKMCDMTIKVGNYLSQHGFRGVFGMDFLISRDGSIYPCDINPRRQGGYFCQVMMSKDVSVIDLELQIILGETPHMPDYKAFQANYCWAHSKLTPFRQHSVITQELSKSSPFLPFTEIGASHAAIYYPKGHTFVLGNPGFYLETGVNYEELKKSVLSTTHKLIDSCFVAL